jgi:shikimate kinase
MNNIYLVGMPGSGKTIIGKKLASKINWAHLDLDSFIEENEKRTISDIFKYSDETIFREIERFYLQKTDKFSQTVISTGGGTPAYFDNMNWINNHGLSLYLDIPIDELIERVSKFPLKRAVISELTATELQEKMYNLLESRKKFYSLSHLILQEDLLIDNSINTDFQHVIEIKNIIFQNVNFW